DATSQKTTEQLARTREMRDRLEKLSDEMDRLKEQGSAEQGKQGTGGAGGTGGASAEAERARMEMTRQAQEIRDLLRQINLPESRSAQGSGGLTFEGQGMTLSDPG